jgi:SAM-dependent methyltransferase
MGVIDAYRLVREEMPDVQLALVGSMATDDPEGWDFFHRTFRYADGDPAHRPVSHVRAQIDGVERFISLEPRSRLLDLGCGFGHQTLELARRGHRVLGMDESERSLSEARQAARSDRLNVHFTRNDPRQIPYRGEFDAVLCLSSAFGRLVSERDDQRALESILRSLKPGAKLLLDQLNKEWLMRHFEPNSWEQNTEGRGEVLLERVSFNFETGRLDSHRTLVSKDGTRTPIQASVRVYTLTELKALLQRAGLRYVSCWGGFDGSAYGMDSPRMIVLAERPAEARPAKRDRDAGLATAIKIKGRRR